MKKLLLILALPLVAIADGYEGQYSNNPYAVPKAQIQPGRTYQLRNSAGEYRGQIGGSKYHPNSVNNQFGRYGSKYSPDSINNKHSPSGSPYGAESPNNKYGKGLSVYE